MEVSNRTLLKQSPSIPKNTLRNPKIPEASDLEESVLGGLLIEKDAITDVIGLLKPSDFYQERHQLIYQSVLTLANSDQAIDLITVANQLRKDGKLERVGNVGYLASLTSYVASADHIEDHARIIMEYAMRRALIKASGSMRHNAFDEAQDIFGVLDQAEQSLFDVSNRNISNNQLEINTLVAQAVRELEAKKDRPSGITGIPSGCIALDRIIHGWQRSDFVVIAGRPGMGKTALMLYLARKAAIDHGASVAFFSLEMSSLQLTNRMISSEAGIEGEKIKKGNLQEYEWQQLYHKVGQLSDAPIYIDDTPALSLRELRAKCRRLKPDIVFLDYIQLMEGDRERRGVSNREQQIAQISRGIKSIAKANNAVFIVAAQLSRAVEAQGGDKRPHLHHLRESGAIEQDADLVMFLYRAAYYGITQSDDGADLSDQAEIIIAKHRNGPTGSVFLRYLPEIMNFTEAERQDGIMESRINDF